MTKFILPFFIFLFFVSCSTKAPKEVKMEIDMKAEMIQADRDFSKLSEAKGMKAAFIEYLDSEGVLLRPDAMPLKGANAVDFISQENDSGFSISWEPRGAAIAKSGELGYTYGTYLIKFNHKDSVQKGTYVSVWKKGADGKWKYVMDSGNEGLGEP